MNTLNNEEKILLKILKARTPLSRKEIAVMTGQSLTKTALMLRQLENRGIIEGFAGNSSGGRSPQLFKIKDDLCFAVGIDVGSEYLRMGLSNTNGEIISRYRHRYNIDKIRTISIDFLISKIHDLAKVAAVPYEKICAIGIGITGIVQEWEGKCLSLRNTPGWKDLNLSFLLSEASGIRHVSVMDSVKAMAYAEKIFGQCRDIDNFVLLNIGIGLGAGIVINGELLSGKQGTTGEIGHMHIRPSNELCVCGNYGCLEAIASGWALVKKSKKAILGGVETTIGTHHDKSSGGSPGSFPDINLTNIIIAAHNGDKFALTLLDTMSKDMAVGIGSLMNLLNLERIVLAGGLIRHAHTYMMDPLLREVKGTVIPWLTKHIDIRLSEIGEWDGVLGASSWAIERKLIGGGPDS